MPIQPFALSNQFHSDLGIIFFTKPDGSPTDQDAMKALNGTGVAGLKQIHGNRVLRVDRPIGRTEQADGMITDVPGLVLTIRAADCQNFVVFAPQRKVAGVIHAGWRGVAAGVIPEFFRVLRQEWDIDGAGTFVFGGPSLCITCADFTDPRSEVPLLQDFIVGNCIDLRAAADSQFAAAGVPADQRERMPQCTRCEPQAYWTYRGGDREAVKNGAVNMLACVIRA